MCSVLKFCRCLSRQSVTIGTRIVKIALGVTGCIAAYKAIEVMRGLQKAGVSVQVILTRVGGRIRRSADF